MEMKEVKAQIKDYVRDHYKYYGFYPYDVEVYDDEDKQIEIANNRFQEMCQ